jgi:hypothetical protein
MLQETMAEPLQLVLLMAWLEVDIHWVSPELETAHSECVAVA